MLSAVRKFEEGESFLILAPIGKDSSLLASALSDAGLRCEQVPTIRLLRDHLAESTDHFGGVILAEEALTRDDVSSLLDILDKQPPWSDLPFILLNKRADDSKGIRFLLDSLGRSNITLLERPFTLVTLLSTVRTALRTRRKQYELKHLLDDKEKALDEIRRSNEELAQFAYVASHDLKEPLRVVRTQLQFAKRLMDGKWEPRPAEHLNFAMESAGRMYDLINDLLEYARVGASNEKAINVDCAKAIEEVIDDLSSAIREAGAKLEIGNLPIVHAVLPQVKQLFQNLLGNALKYRSTEPVFISIKSELRDKQALFSVKDNGIGIEPQYASKIFELFQRLHHRTEYQGTGIGLSICKKIVEQHGGRIWVESQLGQGAEFKFTLPLSPNGGVE